MSKIKDAVLDNYISPYLAKVSRLKRRILLIDGFAGPGVFDDGSPGSPMVMCKAAEKYAQGNYQAFFFNNEDKYHERLKCVLDKAGWLGAATPILGDTTKILPHLPTLLKNQTVFLYLDPFGPTGCPFSLLEPFLTRDNAYSTEIVIMMHMPIAHRLAARNVVEEGREYDTIIQKYHSTMTDIFGGDYWKEMMLSPTLLREEREFRLIEAYQSNLARYLPFTGSCPVRENTNSRIKYFIVFASRHPDAMLLMNDAMINAYHERMHEAAFAGTFFEDAHWSEFVSSQGLEEAIIQEIKGCPGLSRKDLWLRIVQNNFMQYRESDFRKAVQQLVDDAVLSCPTRRKTKRLNETCQFYIS